MINKGKKDIPIYSKPELNLEIYPLDEKRWGDFELLFGERGACGGCWCMYWRLKRSDFNKQRGNSNKLAIHALVERNENTGLLAYVDGKPAGWCALAPREVYSKLENSKVWKRIDDRPVWAIPCFFVAKAFRRKGILLELIKGAIHYCKSQNVKIMEGYPVAPYADKIPDAFAYTGFPSVFEEAGFVEAERRSPSKPMMRYYISANYTN
jgi:GNAT superfamily N-acetyltransferase